MPCQWSEIRKDGGLKFVVSHSSVLSAVEGSAFFRMDEWTSYHLSRFSAATRPPAGVPKCWCVKRRSERSRGGAESRKGYGFAAWQQGP